MIKQFKRSTAFFVVFLLCACGGPPLPPTARPTVAPDGPGSMVMTPPPQATPEPQAASRFLLPQGQTIGTRFFAPDGFHRTELAAGSFGHYLRNQALLPDGTPAALFDGSEKWDSDYEAVLTHPVKLQLLRAPQAVYLLYLSYLYEKEDYDKISVKFMDGFTFPFTRWQAGERLAVANNSVYWVEAETPGTFEDYLKQVYIYCNLTTLRKELTPVNINNLGVGDILLHADNPAHCLIVADMAENPATGEKIYMFVQGGNPAQPLQVVRNQAEPQLSPWFSSQNKEFITPASIFGASNTFRLLS